MAVMTELYSQYLQYLLTLSQPQTQPQIEAAQLEAAQPETPPDQGGAGRAERREEEDRDLLDWLYLSSRLALLLSIVYFYSSITRLLIVLGLAGSFYAFQVSCFYINLEKNHPSFK